VKTKAKHPADVLKRIRCRDGRCYELCLKAILGLDWDSGVTLVHGTVAGNGHAWLTLENGNVYCAIQDQDYSPTAYAQIAHAIVERTYTAREAADALCTTGHCGPWHDAN